MSNNNYIMQYIQQHLKYVAALPRKVTDTFEYVANL